MNFKKIAAIVLAFAMVFAFAACNKGKDETKPTETTTEKVTYNETAPAEPLVTSKGDVIYPEYTYVSDGESGSYTEVVENIEVVYQSYYGYHNSYSKIIDLKIEDIDRMGSLDGYATVELLGVGEGESMRIGYRCYDAEGNVVRNVFFSVWYDGAVKAGDVVKDCRMDIPRNTAKIEFFDYVEA